MAQEYPMVQIEWYDACSFDGWHEKALAVALVPERAFSVGYLVNESDAHLTICSCYQPLANDVGGSWCIPKGCIKEVKRL